MKAPLIKRLFAYIVDIIIVTVVASIITGFIPTSEKVDSLQQKLYEVQNNVTEQKIDIKKLYSENNDISYEINREMVIQNILIITIYLLYFVVVPMYNNGQTLGKKVAKIKISSSLNSEVTMNGMLIRGLVLHGIARDLVAVILIVILKKSLYLNVNSVINILQEAIDIIILFMIMFRKDGRGLHDILGKTKVIEEE